MKTLEPISNFMEEIVVDALENRKTKKLLTGFQDLDNLLGGLNKASLIFVGGRPAMGKTAFALNLAFNVAQQCELNSKEKVVVYFTFDLDRKEIAARILSSKCKVPFHTIKNKYLSQIQADDLFAGCELFKKVPFYVNDRVFNVKDISSELKELTNEGKEIALVVVDSLQYLDVSMKSETNPPSLSNLIYELKRIAREFDTPVLVTSYLDRKVEGRECKRPTLSDLKKLGSSELIIDTVMFLYRDIYYLQAEVVQKRKQEFPEEFILRTIELEQKKIDLVHQAEVIVASNRHGAIGTVKLSFDGEYMSFGDLN